MTGSVPCLMQNAAPCLHFVRKAINIHLEHSDVADHRPLLHLLPSVRLSLNLYPFRNKTEQKKTRAVCSVSAVELGLWRRAAEVATVLRTRTATPAPEGGRSSRFIGGTVC